MIMRIYIYRKRILLSDQQLWTGGISSFKPEHIVESTIVNFKGGSGVIYGVKEDFYKFIKPFSRYYRDVALQKLEEIKPYLNESSYSEMYKNLNKKGSYLYCYW